MESDIVLLIQRLMFQAFMEEEMFKVNRVKKYKALLWKSLLF
jgi:hypothetical protein